MKKTYISEYTHVDGTRWSGPNYDASSFAEAEALAMDYPIQPMRILGELVEIIEVPEGHPLTALQKQVKAQ